MSRLSLTFFEIVIFHREETMEEAISDLDHRTVAFDFRALLC
jgi:hypothetical protein